MREEHRVGIQYLEAATTLLQRVRSRHPSRGLYEAADLQWWWRVPRLTDRLDQLFWFDDHGRPEAAVIATAWGNQIALDPICLPDATPEWVTHVIERGLVHAGELGFETVQLEVDRDDPVTREVLGRHGFTIKEQGLVESWLPAGDRPEVSPLSAGYRLLSRADSPERPHHMIGRGGPDVEQRLRQTSLYRPDLDLVIIDSDERNAAYGMVWFDPVTSTGLVEPMRTEVEHQRRGLARHILTSGLRLLTEAGADRVKVCFEADNPAAESLYLSVGFEPVKWTDVYAGAVSG